MSSKQGTPKMTEADEVELAQWSREKAAFETYAMFYAEKIEPFTSDLIAQIKADPEQIHKIGHKFDIFSMHLE